MSIKVLKMMNGDEIVAECTENLNGDIILNRPRAFQVMPDQMGNVRAGLMPWIMSDPDAKATINLDHITATIDCPVDLEKAYLQQTSGLDLSSKIAV